MIPPETISKIFDAARIEEVVGDYVSLKKRGVNMIGLCPFHNEKTPSFTVSPAKGIYKCFGCGEAGNSANFLMKHEHYSYPDALKHLAQKYGIEVEETIPSAEEQQAQDERESLFNLSSFAQKYFEQTLHETDEGKAIGLTYLKERGFEMETIKKFGVGYCPDGWDNFSLHAKKNGYKKEYLLKTSLSKEKDHQLFDTFRGRVIFPIHSLSGRVLGFGARILGNHPNKPKYINSAESDIYHKGKVLYGLYFARNAIMRQDNCYLVEGYTDVMSLHQAGIENVIASSGTALTPDQVRLLKRFSNNITLLYDGDTAGIKAAFRGIELVLEEGLDVRLVLFPDGEDPDSYSRKYRPAEVREFVEKNTVDFISFKTNLMLSESGKDPIKLAGHIKEIARTIALVPDSIARALYTKRCSEMMQVDENMMTGEINSLRMKLTRTRKTGVEQPDPIAERPAYVEQQPVFTNAHQEKEVIRLLLLFSDKEIQVEGVDEAGEKAFFPIKVIEYIVDDFIEDNLSFENNQCQTIFDIFAKHRESETTPKESEFTNHPDPEVSKLAINLLATNYSLSPNWEKKHRISVKEEEDILKESVLESISCFKLRQIEKMMGKAQEELKASTSDEEIMRLLEDYQKLKAKHVLFARELSRIVTR
jgi:DNA primase